MISSASSAWTAVNDAFALAASPAELPVPGRRPLREPRRRAHRAIRPSSPTTRRARRRCRRPSQALVDDRRHRLPIERSDRQLGVERASSIAHRRRGPRRAQRRALAERPKRRRAAPRRPATPSNPRLAPADRHLARSSPSAHRCTTAPPVAYTSRANTAARLRLPEPSGPCRTDRERRLHCELGATATTATRAPTRDRSASWRVLTECRRERRARHSRSGPPAVVGVVRRRVRRRAPRDRSLSVSGDGLTPSSSASTRRHAAYAVSTAAWSPLAIRTRSSR